MVARLVSETKKVKARKNHTCLGCGKKIKKGEKYFKSTCAMDGHIYDIKECKKCREYYNENCSNCEYYEFCIGENYYVGILKDCMNEKL